MRVAVVGGGIVGLAAAYKLQLAPPHWKITVLEKELQLGRHQSGHNSGVLHAGLYYAPGSAKARLEVDGIRQMTAFAKVHGIPHEICGKLVVATDDSQIAGLRKLEERGGKNGLKGIRWLETAEIRRLEPHCAGVAALHVPEEGIIDYAAVCHVLGDEIRGRGGGVHAGFLGDSVFGRQEGWVLANGKSEVAADFVVACAGFHSARAT